MTRIKKLSTMIVSALALAAIVFTGGALSPNAPAAQAATSTNCNGRTQYYRNGVAWSPWVPTYSKGSTLTGTCILGNGNNSPAVWAVQKTASGYYGQGLGPTGIDSSYGKYTIAAVKYIQGKVGVTQDGKYGPNTHNGSRGASTNGMFFWFSGTKYIRDVASA
ncbi:MAG: peptidoglycan-binding protein [Bifidobacteriaceae bacterium]|jgi:peptidoglycan hydrolase-like protein with peptidoglycan-binding domain|nr:peptidoglycan-binding protein [Bifidobacteriaceae bacterium]